MYTKLSDRAEKTDVLYQQKVFSATRNEQVLLIIAYLQKKRVILEFCKNNNYE